MRKFFLFGAIISLLLSACSTFPNPEKYAKSIVYWDENAPKEQCIGLLINTGLTVTSYNGIAVEWKNRTMVYLPPGTVELTLDANYDCFSTTVMGKDWPFKWTFEAGEVRWLTGWLNDNRPIILITNHEDKTHWLKQPAYTVPLQQGPTVLQ